MKRNFDYAQFLVLYNEFIAGDIELRWLSGVEDTDYTVFKTRLSIILFLFAN